MSIEHPISSRQAIPKLVPKIRDSVDFGALSSVEVGLPPDAALA